MKDSEFKNLMKESGLTTSSEFTDKLMAKLEVDEAQSNLEIFPEFKIYLILALSCILLGMYILSLGSSMVSVIFMETSSKAVFIITLGSLLILINNLFANRNA